MWYPGIWHDFVTGLLGGKADSKTSGLLKEFTWMLVPKAWYICLVKKKKQYYILLYGNKTYQKLII